MNAFLLLLMFAIINICYIYPPPLVLRQKPIYTYVCVCVCERKRL